MQIQRVQNNNYNTSFGSLIIDKNMKPVLYKLSKEELLEINKIAESLKDTKYYDLKINNHKPDYEGDTWAEPIFIPKTKAGRRLAGYLYAHILEGKNSYNNKLKLETKNVNAVFNYETHSDALRAEELAKDTNIRIYTTSYYKGEFGIDKLISAIRAWAKVCTDVLEKSMEFKKSGKPTVLNESEKLIESLTSLPKDEISPETIKTLKNYFKNNPDYGNLFTADDMLELLRNMYEEDILSKKNILTTPIKEGDSSILMYIADIMPTADNSKKYDKILKILSKVQGINYNYKDKNGVSFLEKVMISENEKLLDLIKNEQFEYYPELDYVYENIQNPEFREKVKELTLILKNTDGLNAKDIKSELQSIAFQNTVRGK